MKVLILFFAHNLINRQTRFICTGFVCSLGLSLAISCLFTNIVKRHKGLSDGGIIKIDLDIHMHP